MALKYETARFVRSYGSAAQLPAAAKPEVSFAGRSNVGKSSLINKIFNRKALAKTSSTPGKTVNINFYEADDVYFVDLPGYGFAKAGRDEKQRWADMIAGYFEQTRSYNLVLVLVDIRHDAQKLDVQMIEYLQELELPFVVVLTKGDKLSRNKRNQARFKLTKQFGLEEGQVITTSSKTGEGIEEVKRRIEAACLQL